MTASPASAAPQSFGAPLGFATAPGKVILLGEHTVVHGRPAIAVPLSSLGVTATVWPGSGAFTLVSKDLAQTVRLDEAGDDHLLAAAVRSALRYVHATYPPEWRLDVTGTVPMGAGLGSSAAAAVATVRSVCRAAGSEPSNADVARLAWEAEMAVHGRSSGVDPAVCAFGEPIFFHRGAATPLEIGGMFHFVVADSGRPGSTAPQVARVADDMAASPAEYDAWMDRIGALTQKAVHLLAAGDVVTLGRLMNQNHLVLQAMRVSTPVLDSLVDSARSGGALGAKLTGAGGGGSVVALVRAETEAAVADSLSLAGALSVHRIALNPTGAVGVVT